VGFAAYEALRVDPGAQSLPFYGWREDMKPRRQDRQPDLTTVLIIVLVITGTVLLLTAG
jgi:hypothetical protein